MNCLRYFDMLQPFVLHNSVLQFLLILSEFYSLQTALDTKCTCKRWPDKCYFPNFPQTDGPRRGKRAVIAYVNSKGSGEPARPRSLARTYAVC